MVWTLSVETMDHLYKVFNILNKICRHNRKSYENQLNIFVKLTYIFHYYQIKEESNRVSNKYNISNDKQMRGLWGGPVGKGTCCQTWWPEFSPWGPHDRRGEPIPSCKSLSVQHTRDVMQTCSPPHSNKYNTNEDQCYLHLYLDIKVWMSVDAITGHIWLLAYTWNRGWG